MFLKRAQEQEFMIELEDNLKRQEREPLVERVAREASAIHNLISAANLLDDAGFESEAAEVTKLLEKIAWDVPKSDTTDLTPEKMLQNLEHKGWVFNAEDGEILDTAEPKDGQKIEVHLDGELEVTDESADKKEDVKKDDEAK